MFLSKGDILHFFYTFDKFKLISELVSSGNTVFLTSMTNSDKPNNHCACAIAKFSEQSFKHKKELTQTSNETKWWSFEESLAGCLENIIKL